MSKTKTILLSIFGIALLSLGFSLRDLPESDQEPEEMHVTCQHLFYIIDEETGELSPVLDCSGEYISCDSDMLICQTYLL